MGRCAILFLCAVTLPSCNAGKDNGPREQRAVKADKSGRAQAGEAWKRGNALRDKKEYDKAIAEYDEAIRLDPKFADAYMERGLCWNEKEAYDKGIADFSESIRLDADKELRATAYFNRAIAWHGKGDFDKAIADYSETIRLDPAYGLAFNNRGYSWSKKKEYDKAIRDYNEAIRIEPKQPIAYGNRGFSRFMKKDFDKAIEDFNETIRLDPKDSIALSNRGDCWLATTNYPNAFADFEESLRIDPSNKKIIRDLAWLLAVVPNDKARDGKRAIELSKKVSPENDPKGMETLAAAHAELGDFEEAIRFQEKALMHPQIKENAIAFFRLELYRKKLPFRVELRYRALIK